MQPMPKPAMSGLKPPTYGIQVNKIQTSVGRINSKPYEATRIFYDKAVYLMASSWKW
jgi:hypothetical protein